MQWPLLSLHLPTWGSSALTVLWDDPFDGLDQEAGREGLVQIRETTRFQRRLAGGLALDGRDEDNRQRMTGPQQLMHQINSRSMLQMNIQYKAGSLAQVSPLQKPFDAGEDLGVEAMDLQHPLQRPKDARVIVNDNDQIALVNR
jgi:hypothetical protein